MHVYERFDALSLFNDDYNKITPIEINERINFAIEAQGELEGRTWTKKTAVSLKNQLNSVIYEEPWVTPLFSNFLSIYVCICDFFNPQLGAISRSKSAMPNKR